MPIKNKFNFKKHIFSTALYTLVIIYGAYFYSKTTLSNYNLDISINNKSDIKNDIFKKDLREILKRSDSNNYILNAIRDLSYVETASILSNEDGSKITFTSKKIKAIVNNVVFDEDNTPIASVNSLTNPSRFNTITTDWIGLSGQLVAIRAIGDCSIGYIHGISAYCNNKKVASFDYFQQPNSIGRIWRRNEE